MKRLTELLLLSVMVLAGCATVPIDEIHPVRAPTSMTSDQLRRAILSAVDSTVKKNDASLAVKALNAFQQKILEGNQQKWTVDEAAVDALTLSCRRNDDFLRVRFVISPPTITPQIVESRNLGQSGAQIQKNAVEYIESFEDEIQKQFPSLLVGSK